MAKKRPNEGMKEEDVRRFTKSEDQPLDEDFLTRHLWWWRSAKTSAPGLPVELEPEWDLLFRTQFERAAYNYEFGARLLGKFEFSAPWNQLSEEQRSQLKQRWPSLGMDSIGTISTIPDDFVFSKPGWSKPERLSFNLLMPDETLVRDLKLKFKRWRGELGIEKPGKYGDKTKRWDMIEYMDRRCLLGKARDGDREAAVAQKRRLFVRDIVGSANDTTAVGALRHLAVRLPKPKFADLTLEVRQALQEWIPIQFHESSLLPPTEADLARQSLLVLAGDPSKFAEIHSFLTAETTRHSKRHRTPSPLSLALSVIQTNGIFESASEGVLHFVTAKPPAQNSPLIPLTQKLLLYKQP